MRLSTYLLVPGAYLTVACTLQVVDEADVLDDEDSPSELAQDAGRDAGKASDGGLNHAPDAGAVLPTDADGGAGYPNDAGAAEPRPSPIGANVPDVFYRKLEAEAGKLGESAVIEDNTLAPGGQVVEVAGSGRIDLTVSVDVAGVYNLTVVAGVPVGRGSKHNGLYANDDKLGQLRTDEAMGFYSHAGMWVALNAGHNVLSLRAEWGYTQFDFIELRPIRSTYLKIDPTLRNPKASAPARRLFRFLSDQYGRTILSGQQERASAEVVRAMTGKNPAVLGIDLMDYSPSRVQRQGAPQPGQIQDGLDAWREGGIVTAAWHWNAPKGLVDKVYADAQGNEVDASWYRGFYTYATTFDLAFAMGHPFSEEHTLLIRDIDAIAAELIKLHDADVPVLWRPLHEASGAWFWWGASGPEPYLALWNLMYERLTHHHGLDNLIWVWNGQSIDWYPGDATVDVVSEDIYDGERNYGAQLARFGQATAYSEAPRMVALSETGALLDPDKVRRAGPTFSWFCTWSGPDFVGSGHWNERAMFEKVYASDLVLTREELPDLTVYPIP